MSVNSSVGYRLIRRGRVAGYSRCIESASSWVSSLAAREKLQVAL
jgi:hypothetical protein